MIASQRQNLVLKHDFLPTFSLEVAEIKANPSRTCHFQMPRLWFFPQGSIVGMNPVQIRATVDLYPSTRSALAGHVHHPEAPAGWWTHSPNIPTEESADWLSFFPKGSTRSVSSLPKQA